MVDSIDRRFALIADDGRIAYPYQKTQRSTARYGFALTGPGERDRHGGGYYTSSIEEVIRRVVLDGWSVRARGIRAEESKGDSIGLGKRTFHRYWVASEFRPLVAGATTPPLAYLPKSSSEGIGESSYAMLDAVSTSRFEQALIAVESKISAAQRMMLAGHAYAPDRTASMQRLAELGGYDSYENAMRSTAGLARWSRPSLVQAAWQTRPRLWQSAETTATSTGIGNGG